MKALRHSPIARKFIWSCILSGGLTVGVSKIVDYRAQATFIESNLEQTSDSTLSHLSQTLTEPMWDYSYDAIRGILDRMVKEKVVLEAKVYDAKGTLVSLAEGSSVETTFFEKSAPILRAGETLGQVSLKFDRSSSDKLLQYQMKSFIIQGVLLVITLVGSLYFFVRRDLLSSILRLHQQSLSLQKGDLDQTYNWKSELHEQNELSVIGNSLSEAQRRISELIKDLNEKNQRLLELNSNLEKSIEERSLQMVHSAKMASLGEMAGGIAHEVNNPLAIIMAKANSLKRKCREGTATQEGLLSDLEKIENTGNRIATIIRGLRSFSRNAEKDLPSPSSLNTLIENVLGLCGERLKLNGVTLEVESEVPDFIVNCRSVQIEQVLVNLINNSSDAIQTLTERWIKLELKRQSYPRRIESHPPNQSSFANADESASFESWVEVSITDSGPGIPDAIAEKLMQPFFTTKGVGKGTGLGLSISKGLIEEHGGEFFLDRHCKNTRFVIKLPLFESRPKQNEAQTQSGEQAA